MYDDYENTAVFETQDDAMLENAAKFKSKAFFNHNKYNKQYLIDDENAEMLAATIEKYL